MSNVEGHSIEILSLDKGKSEEQPIAMLTIRPEFQWKMSPVTLMLTTDQVVFVRDTLDRFLNDKDSWLFLTQEEQTALRL